MALGRAEQNVKDIPQSWLNEGLILVKFSPQHRPGVLNYGQMSCFPHLTMTDSLFSSKEKEEIRAKEKGRKIQKNRAGCGRKGKGKPIRSLETCQGKVEAADETLSLPRGHSVLPSSAPASASGLGTMTWT